MKCYMYRHQHAGIVTTHVFTSPPTDEQLAPLISEVERLHGKKGWGKVHEAELFTSEVPSFPTRKPSPFTVAVETDFAEADVGNVGVQATGFVSSLKSFVGLGKKES